MPHEQPGSAAGWFLCGQTACWSLPGAQVVPDCTTEVSTLCALSHAQDRNPINGSATSGTLGTEKATSSLRLSSLMPVLPLWRARALLQARPVLLARGLAPARVGRER